MWEQCTVHSRNAVMAAAKLAAQSHQRQVTTEHLLLGLLAEGRIALKFLKRLKVDPEQVRAAIAALHALDTDDPGSAATEAPTPDQQEFSPAAQRVLELAQDEATQNNSRAVDDVFLLIGLLREQSSPASQILTRLGAGVEQVREALLIFLDPDNKEPFLPPDPADEMTDENIEKTLIALQHEQASVRYEAIRRLHVFFLRAGTEEDHRLDSRAGRDSGNDTRSDAEKLKAMGIAQKQFVQQKRIAEALLVAIDDPSARVRLSAVLMLQHVQSAEAEESLIRHLQSDSSNDIRAFCCSGLNSTSHSPQKRDAWIAALQDSYDQVVSFACSALGKLGDRQAIDPLRTVLAHPSWKVRFHACEALLHLQAVDSEIVNLLEKLDQEPEAAEHNRMLAKIHELHESIAHYRSETEKEALFARTTQAVLERARNQ